MGRFRRGTVAVAVVVPFLLGVLIAYGLDDARTGPKSGTLAHAWAEQLDEGQASSRESDRATWAP